MSVTRVDLNREQEAHAKTREALGCASAREAALRDTIKNMQGEIMSLKRSAEQARMTAEKSFMNFDALKEKSDAELKQSKAQTAEAKDTAKAFERKVDALARDLDAAKASLAQTQKALDASEEKASVLAGKVERVELEKQRANDRLAEASKEISLLKADCMLQDAEMGSQKASADEAMRALRDAQSRERAMKSEIANLKARLAVPK